jgi:hypothetical protein
MTANETLPTTPASTDLPPLPTMSAAEAAHAHGPATPASAPRRRRGLVIGAIVAGGVLALGAAFGGGVATGWAVAGAQTSQVAPGGFPGGEQDGNGPGFGQGGQPPQQGTMPTRPDEDSSSGEDEDGAS